jgi:hypothetical protein
LNLFVYSEHRKIKAKETTEIKMYLRENIQLDKTNKKRSKIKLIFKGNSVAINLTEASREGMKKDEIEYKSILQFTESK